jgi:hypothetical protein
MRKSSSNFAKIGAALNGAALFLSLMTKQEFWLLLLIALCERVYELELRIEALEKEKL